ncbi:class III lanthionine synthetase LanKC [Streptomyces roseus]|uniref:Serine/threonine protein kinase n=1 Tax=Streptomyces roseus TaxID=66430 RepID=A0A0J6XGS1_9ACTN|nr:class III lanthionine synthetase LanKC [Streptomyces roseus]KMO93407.1 serine/threonine protein kinase [Streptomyces roseus]
MDNQYEAYTFADPLFYESPRAWGAREEFAAATRPLPTGWERGDLEIWSVAHPVDVVLPDQGWKIHVSSCAADAEEVLEALHAWCLKEHVTFKFLRGLPILQVQNSKYAPRGASGKFCTVYPRDEDELERCLDGLGTLLAGRRGPYILSDARWQEGPLYLRYGGFAERHCRNAAGERVLALAGPDGRLIPDVRGPGFSIPDWVPVPRCIAHAVEARRAARGPDLPYTVERVLHFSNAGGVYLARPAPGEPQVVLKEARPYAGLDQRGVDAVTRLRHEHGILTLLAGIPGVPRIPATPAATPGAVPGRQGLFTVWEHEFLAQEYVEGESLSQWLTGRYPLIHPAPTPGAVAAYTREALTLLKGVEDTLAAIHARGIVFGDLHPRNLIVRPDGGICFIDFELASPQESFVRPALGAAGFTAPAGLSGTAIDHYALAAIRLWLFLPLVQLTALDPAKAGELADVIEHRFPVPEGYTAPIRTMMAHATERPAPAGPPRPGIGRNRAAARSLLTATPADWPQLRDSLAAGITAMATPDRTDRLFPGDVAQFRHGGLGLAHGAAGVLYALHTTGAGVREEHVHWLVRASRTGVTAPGLYFGGHGVAYVLDLLGEHEAALDLLVSLEAAREDTTGPSLATGAAGIGLTLLHFARATGDHRMLAQAQALILEAADTLDKRGRDDARRPAGLLAGASGAALALIRLHEHTTDDTLLERAAALLDLDLDRCLTVADGTTQVVDGRRVLPYIETGSAGIGLALHALLAHRPESAASSYEEGIRRAAEPEFIIQPGLFNGRAGLIGYLALTAARADVRADSPGGTAALLDRHRALLTLHHVTYAGHLAFPGDQLLRLSADLATGSAGVLLALGTALYTTPFLPWTG